MGRLSLPAVPCASLTVVLASFGTFLFLASVLEHGRVLVARRDVDALHAMSLEGRARICRDAAVRFLLLAERHERMRVRLGREADRWVERMYREMK